MWHSIHEIAYTGAIGMEPGKQCYGFQDEGQELGKMVLLLDS